MLCEKIKELRKSLGLNQVEFGKKINVSKQCVSNWESGYIQPSVEMVLRIATAFSVSADYLLGLPSRRQLDVDGLTDEQILHLRNIVDDLRNSRK